ncbi:MAG: tRNA (N6-threonylcarbamoyladenosine(37)-N6)-methyltransferase TrmO [Promethearchaeia archaeon]
MMKMKSIGTVKSKFSEPVDPFKMKKHKSTIIIHDEFEEGLFKIENSEYLQILFFFHESEEKEDLKGPTYSGEVRGVFASRSPHRPNLIGLTTVKLLKREENKLIVKGLDAIDGTPVIDIKPFALSMDTEEKERLKLKHELKNPRRKILKLIRAHDHKTLLKEAGVLHGHYCPGLALGVMVGAHMIREIGWRPEGLEHLIVITETNNCALDGIQYVTGCTFGNNGLIFRDLGKTAFTIASRKGEGIRLCVKKNFQEMLQENYPEYYQTFEKVIINREGNEEILARFKRLGRDISFSLIQYDVTDLFNIEQVQIDIPEYAPIHGSEVCSKCGERTMVSRIVKEDGNFYCLQCSNANYKELSGHGIENINN